MSKNKKNRKAESRIVGSRLVTIFSSSLVLLILGIVAFMTVLATEVSNLVKESIGFSVVLEDNIDKKELKAMDLFIKKAPYTKSFVFVSKEDALAELTKELGESPEEFLGFNPLSASYEVKLNAEYANNDSIKKIEKEIRGISKSISDFNYRKEIVQLVNDNMKKAGTILVALAIGLFFISFMLINNTIRLHIYSKRFLIHTMKLVGATSWFIRKPFIKSNITNGIIASFLAIGALYGMMQYMITEFEGFRVLINDKLMIIVFSIFLFLGIIISLIT